jgi:hypothetical protein
MLIASSRQARNTNLLVIPGHLGFPNMRIRSCPKLIGCAKGWHSATGHRPCALSDHRPRPICGPIMTTATGNFCARLAGRGRWRQAEESRQALVGLDVAEARALTDRPFWLTCNCDLN